jgi:hypothetical protein
MKHIIILAALCLAALTTFTTRAQNIVINDDCSNTSKVTWIGSGVSVISSEPYPNGDIYRYQVGNEGGTYLVYQLPEGEVVKSVVVLFYKPAGVWDLKFGVKGDDWENSADWNKCAIENMGNEVVKYVYIPGVTGAPNSDRMDGNQAQIEFGTSGVNGGQIMSVVINGSGYSIKYSLKKDGQTVKSETLDIPAGE